MDATEPAFRWNLEGLRDSTQERGVLSMIDVLEKHQGVLDGSALGSGKSYKAYCAAMNLTDHVCILAPKPVLTQWRRVATHFNHRPLFVEGYERLRYGSTRWVKRVTTITKSGKKIKTFRWDLPKDAILIVDECQNLKAFPLSMTAKMVCAAYAAGHKMILASATPATGAHEMFTLGLALGLHGPTNAEFFAWAESYGCVRQGNYLQNRASKKQMEALHAAIYPTHGHRIRAEEIPNFPTNNVIFEAWDLGDAETAETKAAYEEMARDLADLARKEAYARVAGAEFVIMLRARQRAELMKLPAIAEKVRDLVREGYSVPVFLNFDASLRLLADQLQVRDFIKGGQTEDARQRVVDRFQRGDSKVLLLNLRAGGAGLSLHDMTGRHPRVAIINASWSAFDTRQATGRHCRLGGSPTTTIIPHCAGSEIEERIAEIVSKKLANLDAIQDGKRDADPEITNLFVKNMLTPV